MKKTKAIPIINETSCQLTPELEKEIRDLIFYLIESEKKDEPILENEIFFGNSENGYLSLSGQKAISYRVVFNILSKTFCKDDRVSPKVVENLLNDAILDVMDINGKEKDLSEEEKYFRAIEKVKERLNLRNREFVVYYPVFGIKSDGFPIRIGKLEFFVMDSTSAKDIKLNISKKNSNMKNQFNKREQQILRKNKLWKKSFFRLESRGWDDQIACHNALQEARAYIEILNFFMDIVQYNYGYIYLPGNSKSETIQTFSKDKMDELGYRYHHQVAGPLTEVSLENLLNYEKNSSIGLTRVIELLEKNRNDFEERLLAAVRWAGKGTVLQINKLKEDAFLYYTIALETILLPENENSEITYRLRLRVAHLLSDSKNGKKGISDQMKDLYTIRSKIVHNGDFQVSEQDLTSLWYVVKNCLVHLLRDEPFCTMKNADDLISWFDEKNFG